MRRPLISVCIPTYNRREILSQILECIRLQTVQDREILVCNDASTDDTKAYLDGLKWPDLRVFHNETNRNLPGTMTRLVSEAKGQFIAIQHDHDPCEPSMLERLLETLARHPTAGFACSAYNALSDEGILTPNPEITEFRLFGPDGILSGQEMVRTLATQIHTPLSVTGTLFRSETVAAAGGYRPDWHLAADEDLYRRVASLSDVAFCPERLYHLRGRPKESTARFGGWRSIYNTYAFRKDTVSHYWKVGPLRKAWGLLRLQTLMIHALWRESVSQWLKGNREVLGKAVTDEVFPPLPPGASLPGLVLRCTLRLWTLVLTATLPVGVYFGRIRRERC